MMDGIQDPDGSEMRRKRKRFKKLFVGDRVEVRSLEKGFKGSWHIGSVIAREDHACQIRYEHLLLDDGSENLIERVGVPFIDDGNVSINRAPPGYRGLMRPLPPQLQLDKGCLHYGQCVDVYHQEAWWEGVVFDHEDGAANRKIFFPDIGDVIKFGSELFRITLDWDEFTGEWKPRGNWLFLELIEEFEREWPLQVSVRQIWYDLQEKNGFDWLMEWTSLKRAIWENLVLEVIYDNFKLTLEELFLKLGFPVNLVQESEQVLGLPQTAPSSVTLTLQADLGHSLPVVRLQNHGSPIGLRPIDLNIDNHQSIEEKVSQDILESALEDDLMDMNPVTSLEMPCHEGVRAVQVPPALWNSSFNPDKSCYGDTLAVQVLPALWNSSFNPEKSCHEDTQSLHFPPALRNSLFNPEKSCREDTHTAQFTPAFWNSSISSNTSSVGLCSTSSKMTGSKLLTKRERNRWLPAGRDLVPEAEFCQDAVTQYNLFYNSKKKPPSDLTMSVRKHLAYLGWKIEFTRERGIPRLRYTSTDGKCYFSLRTLCWDMKAPALDIISSVSQHDKGIASAAHDVSLSCMCIEQPHTNRGAVCVMPSSPDVTVEPAGYFPQAVLDYYSLALEDESDHSIWSRDSNIRDLISKAKKHLIANQWKLWYRQKGSKQELRYSSPSGRCYYSLRTACKGCIDEGGVSICGASTCTREQSINASGVSDCGASTYRPDQSINASEETEHLASKQKVLGTEKTRKEKIGDLNFKSHLLQIDQDAGSPLMKEGKKSNGLIEVRDDSPAPVVGSKERAQQVVAASSSHHNPRNILSWLIDNNVVLPNSKVHYRSKKGKRMAEGQITRDGIECSCCQNVYNLSKFEAHAGSTYHRPSANIFLEDGRSILDCQMHLKRENKFKNVKRDPCGMKSKQHKSRSDYICSVCHFGGELILCDQCPSSFHTTCLGLKVVPDGEWFCPSCCCRICGQSTFNKDIEQFADNSVLNCNQCEHQYHVGCLRRRGLVRMDSYPKGNWFCNKRCEQIFFGLRKLLGKPVPVGEDNLTWTLLRYTKCEIDDDPSEIEAVMENYNKLSVALGVMHECFEPVKESRTRRYLIDDVIFSRWSELNRLNFRGFYTVMLERNGEAISVATVRVYGEKVAEVPLIGTRFKYRRCRMCHILMNELEKILVDLGVERLVLPAIQSVLKTWTTSFGFSKMTKSERLSFLDYTFLDFQGTIMCQKLLTKVPVTGLSPSRGEGIDADGHSPVSEVVQADQFQEKGTVEQKPADVAARDDVHNVYAPPVVVVSQPTSLECIQSQSKIDDGNADCEENEKGGNEPLRFYKRRRRH